MADHLTSPPLSKARMRAIVRYIERVRNRLYLAHWSVTVIEEYPTGGDAWASIDPVIGRYVAAIRFGPGFFDLAPDKARGVIVHEMLHLSRAQSMILVLESWYKDQLGQNQYDIFAYEYKRALEYEVDLLTTAIAGDFPLPKAWPK